MDDYPTGSFVSPSNWIDANLSPNKHIREYIQFTTAILYLIDQDMVVLEAYEVSCEMHMENSIPSVWISVPRYIWSIKLRKIKMHTHPGNVFKAGKHYSIILIPESNGRFPLNYTGEVLIDGWDSEGHMDFTEWTLYLVGVGGLTATNKKSELLKK